MLTQQILKHILEYNPETGIFIWKNPIRDSTKIGKIAGCYRRKNGYVIISINKKAYKAHRLAWLYMTGVWPKEDIDHINGKKDDNRLCNLREATRTQNNGNMKRRKDNKSGLKGIFWHSQRQKWTAQVAINGKSKHLGLFDCPAAAHFAYIIAADKVFGEFARNF